MVTDGELRRRSWFAGFVDAVEGLVHRDTSFAFIEDGEASLSVPVPHTAGPIRRVGGIATHELAFARSVATRPVKVTLPAPSVIHFFRGPEGIDPGVYPDEDAYWRDLLAVYRAEIEALGRLGCRYVQLDEVPIALLCDARVQARVAEWGWDWRALLARYVGAINDAVAAAAGRDGDRRPPVPGELPRPLDRERRLRAGGRGAVPGGARGRLPPRVRQRASGGLPAAPLRAGRQGRRPRPGDARRARRWRDETVLGRRIDEAARVVPLERLALSPQCGFGTTVGGAPMSEDDQWRKLELVARVAREVWR